MTARLLVCASGGGRSFDNLVARCRAGSPEAEVVGLFASRPGIGAIERAERLEIPVSMRQVDEGRAEDNLFAVAEDAAVDLVVLAGYLKRVVIPPAFRDRVLNIHPSLLPAFGGAGFYGDRVHRAVLERGCQFTGCTVHLVTEEFDAGPILLQRCIPVLPEDTVQSLAARVFEEEKLALPRAIEELLRSRE